VVVYYDFEKFNEKERLQIRQFIDPMLKVGWFKRNVDPFFIKNTCRKFLQHSSAPTDEELIQILFEFNYKKFVVNPLGPLNDMDLSDIEKFETLVLGR